MKISFSLSLFSMKKKKILLTKTLKDLALAIHVRDSKTERSSNTFMELLYINNQRTVFIIINTGFSWSEFRFNFEWYTTSLYILWSIACLHVENFKKPSFVLNFKRCFFLKKQINKPTNRFQFSFVFFFHFWIYHILSLKSH